MRALIMISVVLFGLLALNTEAFMVRGLIPRHQRMYATRLLSANKKGAKLFGMGVFNLHNVSEIQADATTHPPSTSIVNAGLTSVGAGAGGNGTAEPPHHHSEDDNNNDDNVMSQFSSKKSVPVVSGLGLGQSFDVVTKLATTASSLAPTDSSSSSHSRTKTDWEQMRDAHEKIDTIQRKVDALEKALGDPKTLKGGRDASSSKYLSAKDKKLQAQTEMDDFMKSLKMQQMSLSPQNVERCAMLVFFGLGSIIGSSIFHRFWLLGGLVGSWWASDAVNRDTKYGLLARRVGVQIAQLIRDLQERWNYLVIYYETGRLAYASQKRWEKIDKRFKIDERFQEFKKLAMKRATQLNNEAGIKETFTDIWSATKKVGREAATEAAKIDSRYAVTANLRDFTKGLYLMTGSRLGSWLDDVREVGSGGAVRRGSRWGQRGGRNRGAYYSDVNPWHPTWLLGPENKDVVRERRAVRERRMRENARNRKRYENEQGAGGLFGGGLFGP
jgi:hypothetical protein